MTPSRSTRITGTTASHSPVSRREVLAAVGGSVAVWGTSRSSADAGPIDGGPLRVRVYPGPLPWRLRLRNVVLGPGDGWSPALRDALAAVEGAFEQISEYARERSRLESPEFRVERGERVRLPRTAIRRPSDAVVPSIEAVLEGFHRRLRERDALTGSACHVLLCWAPLNYRVGYGGTLSPNALVAGGPDGDDGGVAGDSEATPGDALTVANVGATERWDSRAVTRNIAIHETLHTFLTSEIAASVVGSACDHDLGRAVRVDESTLRISPMATAYAGRDEIGAGTRFHGTGCYDHASFSRHDGTDGIDTWEYTTDLSEATLEGVTRYLERTAFG